MKNILDNFCKLRRWIRVYICFLIPAIIAVIPLFFLKFIVTYVIIGITALILLPLFIYTEEKHHEQEIEEQQDFINQKISYYLKSLKQNSFPIKQTSTNDLPLQLTLTGVKFNKKEEKLYYCKIGDKVSIKHIPSAENPNAIHIINQRTNSTMGLVGNTLAETLIEKHGKQCIFFGEVSDIAYGDENTVSCTIEITK